MSKLKFTITIEAPDVIEIDVTAVTMAFDTIGNVYDAVACKAILREFEKQLFLPEIMPRVLSGQVSGYPTIAWRLEREEVS